MLLLEILAAAEDELPPCELTAPQQVFTQKELKNKSMNSPKVVIMWIMSDISKCRTLTARPVGDVDPAAERDSEYEV